MHVARPDGHTVAAAVSCRFATRRYSPGLSIVRQLLAHGTGINRTMTREIGLSVCAAIRAFARGRYARAISLLRDPPRLR